ncbi:hypothetical protein [Mechercharimyces sp. CAU 1602]|uniref:hypothetical protein n=1 Tax=Mechercharimyces sp. CAU 1602 TaxID=2973933 RepID=UPI002161EA2F|nr:hypothetical protein [Mechercharimyces sp. CAU 1602]MCS1350318.1 hypothetical protein [Mechercharimyces sp. CAU 1602]
MATAVSLTDAKAYFDVEVLHSDAWDEVDDTKRQKALNNAERILYRYYSSSYDIDDEDNRMPVEAVYEQALWMLRKDDAIQKAELGVLQVSVEGVSVLTKGAGTDDIAPEVKKIIAHDSGASRRSTWTVI